MTRPAISVVMSVYNGEKFLAEAVDSVLNQTFTDFEFIIIDDGSTDQTAQILSDYATRDSRIRIISQENRGRAESLNRGIELARGDLIARMDADDVCLPHRLQDQLEYMNGRPKLGLLGSHVDLITPGSRNLGPWFALPTTDGDIRRGLADGCPLIHPTVMMRRDVIMSAGGYRKLLLDADDYDMFLRVSELTQMANLPQALLLYRIHAGQVSMRGIVAQTYCCMAAKAAAAMRSRGLPDPLNDTVEVNRDVLLRLGITAEEIEREEFRYFAYRLRMLLDSDPESALDVISEYVHLCDARAGEQATATDALLRGASICYRSKRFGRALVFAGRAATRGPGMVAQHVGMAVGRRVRRIGGLTKEES